MSSDDNVIATVKDRALAQTKRSGSQALRPLDEKDVAEIVEFISRHLSQKITVKRLADIIGLSRHHFSRRFKLNVGQSPYVFVTTQRMERARKLLIETSLSCEEIAEQVGFSHMEHFRAQFQKCFFKNPSQLRRKSSVCDLPPNAERERASK